jgi:hypothetical protein
MQTLGTPFTIREVELRDEVAMRVLAAILPAMPSPSAAAAALPVVFELAEAFIHHSRGRPTAPVVEETTSSQLVKS